MRNTLINIIKQTGWTPTQWQQHTGLTRQAYYNIMQGKTSRVRMPTRIAVIKGLFDQGFGELVEQLIPETANVFQVKNYLVSQNKDNQWERLNMGTWEVEVFNFGWKKKDAES